MKALIQENLFQEFLEAYSVKSGKSVHVADENRELTLRFQSHMEIVQNIPECMYSSFDVSDFILKVVEAEYLVPNEWLPDLSCRYAVSSFYEALLKKVACDLLIDLSENFIRKFVQIYDALTFKRFTKSS